MTAAAAAASAICSATPAGSPLAVSVTGGHRNDVTQLLPLSYGIAPVRGKRGRPASAPIGCSPTAAMTRDKYRRALWQRGIKPVIARRGTEHGSGLGAIRWVLERSFAWLHNFRRLRTRYERCADRHLAFLKLGCAVICQRLLSDF